MADLEFSPVSPLSANGYPFTPIATPTIGGVAFDLAYGLNGNVKVYSFVAHSHAATSFSGDLVKHHPRKLVLRCISRSNADSSFSVPAQFLQISRAELRQQRVHVQLVSAEHPGWHGSLHWEQCEAQHPGLFDLGELKDVGISQRRYGKRSAEIERR